MYRKPDPPCTSCAVFNLSCDSFVYSQMAMLTPISCTEVMNAATAAASKVTGMPAEKLKEPGVIQDLWSGMLDDILGAKKIAKA